MLAYNIQTMFERIKKKRDNFLSKLKTSDNVTVTTLLTVSKTAQQLVHAT